MLSVNQRANLVLIALGTALMAWGGVDVRVVLGGLLLATWHRGLADD
jgi:hypothetical protein